jgi:hypothetical protein
VKLNDITPARRVETLSVLAGAALVMLLVKLHHGASAGSLLAWAWLAFGLLFVGLFIAPLGRLIAWGWLQFGHLMGMVMSRVLLSAVFFLVLLPVALLRRWVTRADPLVLRRRPAGASYYHEVNREFTEADLRNPW